VGRGSGGGPTAHGPRPEPTAADGLSIGRVVAASFGSAASPAGCKSRKGFALYMSEDTKVGPHFWLHSVVLYMKHLLCFLSV
jgi:hypothetical protein